MRTSAATTNPSAKKLTFDQFMRDYETAPGHWELHDGVPVRKHDPAKAQAEQFGHIDSKAEIFLALRAAIRNARLNCRAVTDGATVKINETTGYIPDALVYCGERADKTALQAPDPVIIV